MEIVKADLIRRILVKKIQKLLETRFVLFALCVLWIHLSFGLEFFPFTHQSIEESMCTSHLEDLVHRQDQFFSFR